MAESVWVSVQFVNQPKPSNPKYGSIKTAEYGYISVPAERLGLFQPKRKFCIEIEQKGNYTNFIKMAQQGPAAPQQRPQGSNRNLQQSVQPRQAPTQQPQVLPPDMLEKERLIFATGVVGRAMGSGQFGEPEIKGLLKAALNAWDECVGGKVPVTAYSPGLDYQGPDDTGINDPLPDPNSYGADQSDMDEIPY